MTPRQYRSHIDRNLGWPPISQSLMVTFPFVILRMLNPTVGIISSLNCPDCRVQLCLKISCCCLTIDSFTAITLTNVVFPEYCRPTSVSSISSFQKRLLNQSRIRLIRASILITNICFCLKKEGETSLKSAVKQTSHYFEISITDTQQGEDNFDSLSNSPLDGRLTLMDDFIIQKFQMWQHPLF